MPKKLNSRRTCCTKGWNIGLGSIGFCLSIFGILIGMFWEDIFKSILLKEMTLRPDSQMYENWKTPPFDLNLDIYLFNWTNYEEFQNASTKPVLQQLGPYRFTETPDKVDIKWHPENASVSYKRKSDFYFNPIESKGSLDDEIVTLNPVALSAATKGKYWDSMRRKLIDVGLKIYFQEIFVKKTADELLFTGYSDEMIDMARAVPIFGSEMEVPFDKFGWFYTRNGSADLTGVFNVYTGVDDISKIGQMHTWNYKTYSGFFDSYCGLINGSAGEFQPPNIQPKGSVSLFTPDMCRTVQLDYMNTEFIHGLQGYKFAGGQRSVDNGSIFPENLCFCGGECVPSGVMNISSCRFGSPVFMSYPHFYNADPFYVNQVEGLSPNADNHEFYMILEPKTGIVLEIAARFQVNMLVEPLKGISVYENIPRIFFPLIWFEQKVQITPELASNVKMLPYILLAGHISAGFLFVVGLVLLCWYPIKKTWTKYKICSSDTKMQNSSVCKKNSIYGNPEELKSLAYSNNEKQLIENSSLLENLKMQNKSEIAICNNKNS